jgi:Effector Associated Constant Component 1
MHDGGNRWRLVVPTGGDTLRQERLTRDLYEALLGAGGITVGFETDKKAVESGHKGAGVTDVVLWAAAALPASPVLITLIKEWCAKDRHRTVNVVHGEHSITITGRPDPAQERMVRDFLSQVSAGTEGKAE